MNAPCGCKIGWTPEGWDVRRTALACHEGHATGDRVPSPPGDWACGYLIEFDDDGPVERVIVMVYETEALAELGAQRLEERFLPLYEGDRPVSHGIVFHCHVSALEDDPDA